MHLVIEKFCNGTAKPRETSSFRWWLQWETQIIQVRFESLARKRMSFLFPYLLTSSTLRIALAIPYDAWFQNYGRWGWKVFYPIGIWSVSYRASRSMSTSLCSTAQALKEKTKRSIISGIFWLPIIGLSGSCHTWCWFIKLLPASSVHQSRHILSMTEPLLFVRRARVTGSDRSNHILLGSRSTDIQISPLQRMVEESALQNMSSIEQVGHLIVPLAQPISNVANTSNLLIRAFRYRTGRISQIGW